MDFKVIILEAVDLANDLADLHGKAMIVRGCMHYADDIDSDFKHKIDRGNSRSDIAQMAKHTKDFVHEHKVAHGDFAAKYPNHPEASYLKHLKVARIKPNHRIITAG